MEFEADHKKLAEELGELIAFFIYHQRGDIEEKSFSQNFPELYWRIFIPAKIKSKQSIKKY
jgi:hypothetical protein